VELVLQYQLIVSKPEKFAEELEKMKTKKIGINTRPNVNSRKRRCEGKINNIIRSANLTTGKKLTTD
jgi:hypothetical protein